MAQLGLFGTAIFAGALLVTSNAGASSIGSQISQLQAQEQSLNNQLSSLRGQASTANQQAAATQQQVAATEARLAQEQQALAQANAALAQTKDKVAATQAQIVVDRSQLASLVTDLYQHGTGDNLSTAIADSSGVSQFVDATLQLQSVSQQFTLFTNKLTAAKASLLSLQSTQQAQQQQVAGLVAGLQSQANRLQSEEAAYAQEASSLTGQAGQLASQIRNIQSHITTLRAEEVAITYYGGSGGGQEGTILRVLPRPVAPGDSYPWGQCTWYVASQTRVPWMPMGNADQWIQEDYSMGTPYAVGSAPRAGSMVVFDPGGAYDPGFGHVAWVVAVLSSHSFVVDEANFLGLGIVDQRMIPTLQGVEGFIYG